LDEDGAVVIDHANICYECLVRNHISLMGQDYALLAPNVSADELLDEGVPEELDDKSEDRLGIFHDLVFEEKPLRRVK